jgi:hypothetical protein
MVLNPKGFQAQCAMDFFWDRETGKLNYKGVTPPVFVFGNTARGLDLQINDDGSPVLLEDGEFTITFSLRNPSIYSEAPLANTDEFEYVSGSSGVYEGVVDLSGTEIAEFMGEASSKDVVIQFTLAEDSNTVSSQPMPALLVNYTANPSFNGS